MRWGAAARVSTGSRRATLASMKRRTFAKVAGGGLVGLLGAGGFLFARRTRMVALPPEGLEYFTPAEFSIFTAIAETMVQVPEGQPTVHDLGIAKIADGVMAKNPVDAQKDFKRVLGLLDNALAGFVLTGATAPFSQLPLAGRERVLRIWENHRVGVIRSGFVAMKRLSMSCYYANEQTWRGVGYAGPPEIPEEFRRAGAPAAAGTEQAR